MLSAGEEVAGCRTPLYFFTTGRMTREYPPIRMTKRRYLRNHERNHKEINYNGPKEALISTM